MSLNFKSVLLLMLFNEALHSCKSPMVVLRPTPPKRELSRVVVKPKPLLPQIKNDIEINPIMLRVTQFKWRSYVMEKFGQHRLLLE